MAIDPRLIQIGLQELPAAIALFKAAFAKKNPGVPEPTDAEVIAAYEDVVRRTLQIDADWKAAHPVEPPPS